MRQKTIIQLFLIFLVIASLSLFFIKYLKKDNKISNKKIDLQKIDLNQNASSTYIENINYISSDNNGNKYRLTAELAEVDNNLTDTMFLTNVIAYIYTKDSDEIKITSNFGKYNTINYNTIFSIDVKVYYTDQFATGEYLDFSFQDNLATMSDNVVYTSQETKLKADMIEIDIISKDTKIFMNEVGKKVIINKKE